MTGPRRGISRRTILRGAAGSVVALSGRALWLPAALARARESAPSRPGTFVEEGGHLVARNERLEVVFDGVSLAFDEQVVLRYLSMLFKLMGVILGGFQSV